MKILITLLSSGNLKLLELAYESVLKQQKTTLDYTIMIVINSLTKEYLEKVQQCFSNVIIKETVSNGKPGKGHNSVLQIFKDHTEFDYIIPIDGDDFLYPFALYRLETYLTYQPDVLFLPFSDILNTHFNGPVLHCPISDKCYLYFNNYIKDHRKTWLRDKISPFTNNVNKTNTPGRLVLCSRKAMAINLQYNEELKCFDDFNVFLHAFDIDSYSHTYNIFMIDDKDILLYNQLHATSVTKNFSNNNKIINQLSEELIFRKSIYNKFLAIRNWDLTRLKFLSADKTPYFTLKNKVEFCETIVNKLNLPCISINRTHLELFKKYAVENDFNDLKEIYN